MTSHWKIPKNWMMRPDGHHSSLQEGCWYPQNQALCLRENFEVTAVVAA
jgi:hypothetical protein